MASIFTKIIRGELPSYKVYEDEEVFAFLALDQVTLGHTLVVPKKEVDHFLDTPEPDYSAVFAAGKKIGRAVHRATASKRVCAMIVGFEVPHFHLHLIPANAMSDLDFKTAQRRTDAEMQDIQNRILKELVREI